MAPCGKKSPRPTPPDVVRRQGRPVDRQYLVDFAAHIGRQIASELAAIDLMTLRPPGGGGMGR